MKRIAWIAIILASVCGLSSVGHAGGPPMSTYCATPPYLVQSAAPNIMLVIDISGSMQFPAYIPDNWDNGGGYYNSQQVAQVPLLSGNNYDGTNQYYGYFDNFTFYQYSGGQFVANGACTQAQWNQPSSWSSTQIPGNLLNWATMTRTDILRKVLIGGKSTTSSYTASTQTLQGEGGTWTYTDTNLNCQFTVTGAYKAAHTITISGHGCTVPITNANVVLDIPQANRMGVIQSIADANQDGIWDAGAPRFGLMIFSSSYVGIILDGCDTQNTTASGLINDLQSQWPYNGTPTGEAISNALDYFKHTRSSTQYGGHNANSTFMTSAKDPWQYSCQKSFILLISDGEWNGSLDPVIPAYQGRIGSFDGTNNDLRPDLPGQQVVTTYDVYVFEGQSGGRNSLRQVAIYGGFTDKDGNGWPYPWTALPADSRLVADVNGLPTASCDPAITWTELCTEWDENQDGIPDNYYESNQGQVLHDSITAAIYDMMREASSGTAVSALTTSSSGTGSMFQAYFDYKVVDGLRTVYWVGHLSALWIDKYGNIREDTDKNQALSLTDDYVLQFYVDTNPSSPTYQQTMVNRYQDVDGLGGTGQPLQLVDTVPLSGITPLWDAGKQLALQDDTTNPRTIYTFIDANNNGAVDSGEFSPSTFVASNATTLQPYLNADSSGTYTATNIINFIRGQYVAGMRERRLTVVDSSGQTHTDQVWKLGDIAYSTPVAVGAPAENYHIIYGDRTYLQFYNQYKQRRVVVYVGANDGMLHAFNAGFYHEGSNPVSWYTDPNGNGNLGKELWAYIPYNLLPQLRWLTATNYCHCYYVDLKPRIVDARVFPADATHPYGWGTILIGGMRLGGGNLPLTNNFSGTNQTRVFSSAYFALDITNPESPPQLLWEYWDLVDSSSTNLGFTTSYPTVVRVGGDYSQVGNWYVIFGSGSGTLPPNLSTDTVQGTVLSNGGMGATTTHWVYILNLYTGAPVRKVDMSAVDASLSGNNAFMADPIGVDLALNYQVDEAYIGASYYNNNSSWFGKMYRINVHEDPIPNDWTFSTFMSFDKPVTAAPSAAVDTYNRLWIYVGTGRYFNATDQSDTSTQYLVGAWDSGSDTITFPTPSNLNDVTNIHVYQNGDVYNGSSYINDFGDYLTNIRSEYNAGTEYGWYLNTSAGERSLDAPTIIGGIVLFPTFIPTTNVCGTGGTSNLYALYYETGTAYYSGEYGFTPVLPCSTGCHAPTSITVGNKTYPELLKQVSLGFGMPSSAVIHSGQEQGATGFVQLGSGQIMRLPFNPAFSLHNQTLFWEERR